MADLTTWLMGRLIALEGLGAINPKGRKLLAWLRKRKLQVN